MPDSYICRPHSHVSRPWSVLESGKFSENPPKCLSAVLSLVSRVVMELKSTQSKETLGVGEVITVITATTNLLMIQPKKISFLGDIRGSS